VLAKIASGRETHDDIHIALAGGTTPRRAYELLAVEIDDPSGVHWWFGDERCVPPTDADSNFRLVTESLLVTGAIPTALVHRIAGELEPSTAAAVYEDELRAHVRAGDAGVPRLDLALLGLGEDGHTASLFPGDPSLQVVDRLVVPVVASKPPSQRITMTLPLLRAAESLVILATGAGKRDAVSRVLAGPDAATPASLLADGSLTLILDEAAAGV
jgi:6-phosphogluconolactonase